jgi:hypothetical protein
VLTTLVKVFRHSRSIVALYYDYALNNFASRALVVVMRDHAKETNLQLLDQESLEEVSQSGKEW